MRIRFGLNLILGGTRLEIMVRTKSYLTRQRLRKRFSNHRFLAYINQEMNLFCDILQGLSPQSSYGFMGVRLEAPQKESHPQFQAEREGSVATASVP